MQAIVLVGGKGSRMWPLTASQPKAMIAVSGKPLIHHHLEWLRSEGVREVVIACGYHANQITEYFTLSPVSGLRVSFSIEDQPLGRGGAAKKAHELIPTRSAPCIISQGDTISDMPLRAAFEAHIRDSHGAGITLTLLLVPYRSRHGVVDLDNRGLVTRFREKPLLPYWAHAGTYIASPYFFKSLPDQGDENSAVENLVSQKKVGSFQSSAYWRSVDTPKDLGEAEADLKLPSLPHEQTF